MFNSSQSSRALSKTEFQLQGTGTNSQVPGRNSSPLSPTLRKCPQQARDSSNDPRWLHCLVQLNDSKKKIVCSLELQAQSLSHLCGAESSAEFPEYAEVKKCILCCVFGVHGGGGCATNKPPGGFLLLKISPCTKGAHRKGTASWFLDLEKNRAEFWAQPCSLGPRTAL